MQARRTLASYLKGAKKFHERYDEQLVYVRYRYDEQRRKRFSAFEIIVEESRWSPPEKPEIVRMDTHSQHGI